MVSHIYHPAVPMQTNDGKVEIFVKCGHNVVIMMVCRNYDNYQTTFIYYVADGGALNNIEY